MTLFVLMFDLAFEPCHEIYYTRRCSKSQAGVFGCRCCTARLRLLDCMADDNSLNSTTTGLNIAFMLTTWTNHTKDYSQEKLFTPSNRRVGETDLFVPRWPRADRSTAHRPRALELPRHARLNRWLEKVAGFRDARDTSAD